MTITRKCKKCARVNIETEVKIFVPFNNDQPDAFDVWDAIDCAELTGVFYCRDCCEIVQTEVVQT
jgi:hypothetical protein